MLVMLTYNNFVSSSNTIFRRYSMAKKRYKKYSTQDKVNYHKKRINDKSLSEDQRFYSHSWLEALRKELIFRIHLSSRILINILVFQKRISISKIAVNRSNQKKR